MSKKVPVGRKTNLLWEKFDRGLKNTDEVIDLFKRRHESRTTLFYDKVVDLGIRWLDQGPSHSASGYYARIDGVDMLLTPNAISTGSRLIKATPKFWDQFPDKNAFPTTLSHIMANREDGGLLVRHDGIRVNAILHQDYVIKDMIDFINVFFEYLQDNVGEISGISVREDGDNDIYSLLVMMGDNLLPEIKSEFGQHMMWSIRMSETGAVDTQTMMGIFRTICLNSATRINKNTSWNHRAEWDNFWQRSLENIKEFSYYADQFGKIFSTLLKAKLELPASDLIRALYDKELIAKKHMEFAIDLSNQPTEDGRVVETQYDLFNILTQAAQELPTLIAHERAAANTMEIFTIPGGLERVCNRNR